MAKNLRAKIPASDTLIVRDINQDTAKRFAEEAKADAKAQGAKEGSYTVEIADSARQIADKSVSVLFFVFVLYVMYCRGAACCHSSLSSTI